MRSIKEIPLAKQTVFLRTDFNVPLDGHQQIVEDARIRAALPAIKYLMAQGAKVVVASHLGRPKGQVQEQMRLQPVAQRLSELLGQPVKYVKDCVGAEVVKAKEALASGEILLLENLRFYEGEEKNDLQFAEQLAQGIDVYINDAFGVVHRRHASVHALPSLIFEKGIGFLIEKEVAALSRILHEPEQPLVVVVGGAKISDKVDVIRNLAQQAETVLVGGGVANAFLKGLGMEVQASLVEGDNGSNADTGQDYSVVARQIWQQAQQSNGAVGGREKIIMPVDAVVAASMESGAETKVIDFAQTAVPQGWMILDIGPKTREMYREVIVKARTIFWNGPMGLFEQEAYAEGTRSVAVAIAESSGYAVLGGGDTEVVVKKFGLEGRFQHVSTGGGASLNFLAQKSLPGMEVLA